MKITILAGSAITAFALSAMPVKAENDTIESHPLADGTIMSLHEAYAVNKILQMTDYLANYSLEGFDAETLISMAQSTVYYPNNEAMWADAAHAMMYKLYGENYMDYAVVCRPTPTAGLLATLDIVLTESFPDVSITSLQLERVATESMALPGRLYLKLREAEYKQMENGLDPNDAYCRQAQQIASRIEAGPTVQ